MEVTQFARDRDKRTFLGRNQGGDGHRDAPSGVAIIDVENVFRRLRENAALPASERQPSLAVIFSASHEVRGSIVSYMNEYIVYAPRVWGRAGTYNLSVRVEEVGGITKNTSAVVREL